MLHIDNYTIICYHSKIQLQSQTRRDNMKLSLVVQIGITAYFTGLAVALYTLITNPNLPKSDPWMVPLLACFVGVAVMSGLCVICRAIKDE